MLKFWKSRPMGLALPPPRPIHQVEDLLHQAAGRWVDERDATATEDERERMRQALAGGASVALVIELHPHQRVQLRVEGGQP